VDQYLALLVSDQLLAPGGCTQPPVFISSQRPLLRNSHGSQLGIEHRMSDADRTESSEQERAGLPDVSPHVSVFSRPLQRLFQNGNPIDAVKVLFYNIGDGRHLPFAAISKTRGNRLVLWPPSDALEPGEFADGHTFAVDHATLELVNGKTHFTRFDENGQRVHEDRGWKLANFPDGLKLWLICAFRVDLLEKQVGAVEQGVWMPQTDSERREEEFRRYAAEMKCIDVSTPPLRGDCLVTVIHVMPDSAGFRGPITRDHFPMGSFWNDWIDGWPDGDCFQIVPTGINLAGVNLLLLSASPPGCLKGGCFVGSVSSYPAST
jgi:hypothetical protein